MNEDFSNKQFLKRSIHEANIDLATNVLMLNKYEDISIIWFDDNIEQKIKQTLEHLHDHILFCSTIDQVIDSIENIIANHKIMLIVCGKYSRQTLHLVHENSKIDSFYMFCMDERLYQDLIDDKKYSKLIGIYTQYGQLIKVLEKHLRLLLKHLSIFKLFIENNRSIRDLEQESVAYSWYQLLRDTLMQMSNETSKQEMLEYCRSYFRGDELKVKQIDDFDRTYDSTAAIRWYTKNHFPFDFVNKALRTEDVNALYHLRYFIIDICQNLKLLFDENFELWQETCDIFQVYRGLTLSEKDIDQLRKSIGKFVSTNGFLSTSFTREVAEMFAVNVLFHIKIDTSLNNIIYANISQMSMIPDEDEVLFDLGATFQITNVDYDGKKWIVTMIGVNNVETLKNDYLALQREDMLDDARESSIKTDLRFGSFLTDLSYHNEAIIYFQNLLHRIPEEDGYHKYYVLQYLADTHNGNKEFDLALDYLMKAYDIGLNLIATGTNHSISLPSVLKSIGMIHSNRDEFILALDYLKNAMQTVDTNDRKLIAKIHKGLGHVYLGKHDYIHSAKHCEQSLEILNLFYPNDIFSIIDIRETLGEIYYEMGNSIIALEHLQESLEIKKTMYPPDNHPDIARMYRLLSCICLETKQYDFSIDYSEKALRYEQQIRSNNHDTIVSLYNIIGYSYFSKKQYDKAIEYYIKSLQIITEKNLLKNTKMDAYLNDQIGLCHSESESNMLALQYYRQALELYQKYSIEDVSDKIIDLEQKIAGLYYNINEYDLCIAQLKKTVSLVENIIDKSQLSSLYYRIGLLFGKIKEEYDLATQYLRLSLEIEENDQINSLNDKQQRILIIYIKLAWFYFQNDQYYFAIEYYENVLKLFQVYPIISDDMESTLSTIYKSLAISYFEIQKYYLAIDYFKRSLNIFNIENKLITDDTKLDIAEFHQRIASCYSKLGQYHLSIEHYRIALEMYENIDPQDEIAIVVLYNNIGWAYGKYGQYDLGLQYCIKSKSILEECLEFEHLYYAQVHNSLGVIFYYKQNFDLAWRNCIKSIDICDKGKHIAIPDNYELLGNIFRQHGAKMLAYSCYLKALELLKSSTSVSYQDIKRIQELLI